MKKTIKAKKTKEVKHMSKVGQSEIGKKQAIENFEEIFVLLAQEAINPGKLRCCKSCTKSLPKLRKNICYDCCPKYLSKDDKNIFC